MINILPVAKPILDSYPSHGAVFSILEAHTQDYLPWVYNLYVQLSAPESFKYGNRLNFLVPDPMRDCCPWLQTINMNRNLALKISDITDLIKHYIDHDYYFYACFNVQQISAYHISSVFNHEVLIYGYNDTKKEFYFSDNYKHGKYSHGIASYKEIEKATELFVSSKDLLGFKGIKYTSQNSFKTFKFDYQTYINLINDYIYQKNSSTRWEVPGTIIKMYEGRKWGIGVYSFVSEYLQTIKGSGKRLDLRGFYVLKEHKTLLKKSLSYVLGNVWAEKYPLVAQTIEKNINILSIIININLKYNMKHDDYLIDKIKCYISELEISDKELFPHLIQILRNERT